MRVREPSQDELREFVDSQVIYNVSELVGDIQGIKGVASGLPVQATELAAPIEYWVGAVEDNGFKIVPVAEDDGFAAVPREYEDRPSRDDLEDSDIFSDPTEAAHEFCEQNDIEPNVMDPLEFWLVDDRLGDLLAEIGCKVDDGFAGLTIWARTTSGQAIWMDSQIKQAWKISRWRRAKITGWNDDLVEDN